jgi:NAD(P)-dependent dehydrogenase (short-subunit alcohol dehydrogenase family)
MPTAGHKALAGQTAIVTGGASGIGRALGEELAARGCTVILADRQLELAREAAVELENRGHAASAAELDVRDLAAFETLAQQVRARFGRIDFLFNNAGIGVGGGMETYAPEDWDDVFDVNLRGVANGVQSVYPILIEQRSGQIINTASMAGLVPSPSQGGRVKLALGEDEMLRLWERSRPMAPELFARRAVDAVLRNEPIIVLPKWWKALWYLERLSPRLSLRLSEALHQRLEAELAGAGAHAARPAVVSNTPGVGVRTD